MNRARTDAYTRTDAVRQRAVSLPEGSTVMEKVRELNEADLSTVAGGAVVLGRPELMTPEERALVEAWRRSVS
jgi:hypothetical protein